MRWWGGPGLIVPESTDRKVSILASYPTLDFSSDPRTDLFAWRYTGGLAGLMRGFFRSVALIIRQNLKLRDTLTYAYYLAGGWRRTEKKIDLDCAGRPCMTAEIYPNENLARIVLCAAHPEYLIWWGGEIEEVNESDAVCLGHGLHRWKAIEPISDTSQDNLTYTWWVVRRMVAWSAKVPDTDMPPIEKGALNDGLRRIVRDNVQWDGTLIDQMRNI
jgi:hypothetical protein